MTTVAKRVDILILPVDSWQQTKTDPSPNDQMKPRENGAV